MEYLLKEEYIVNYIILLLLNYNEIIVFFNLELIGKRLSIFPSLTLGLKRPVHRGLGVER